jgi:hypothetical protein
MSSFVLPRFFPPRDLVTATGEGAGDDEGVDAVARKRRLDISNSNASSGGNEYSSRKYGWVERSAEGDGDRTEDGVDPFDLDNS